jgi:hypothetical protein
LPHVMVPRQISETSIPLSPSVSRCMSPVAPDAARGSQPSRWHRAGKA